MPFAPIVKPEELFDDEHLNATGGLATSLQTYPWGFYPVGGALYKLLPVSVAFNLCLMIGVLYQVVVTSESPRQRQDLIPLQQHRLLQQPVDVQELGDSAGTLKRVRRRLMRIDE